MNNYKGKFFGFVFFCMLQAMLFSVNTFAATGVRYVSPTGDDSNNDGLTAATPYATIQQAVEDLNVCSSVPAYPIYVPVGGGVVHLAAGTYPAPTSIIKAPISFVGDAGKANTFINVIYVAGSDNPIGFHYSAAGIECGASKLYADHSKLSNLTIQSSSPSNIATGLRNDEAEWLILEDVDFKDFGTTYSGAKSPKEGPAAIYLSSIRTAPVVNTFGDWNIIKNVTISNSYRGIVSYSGVAGYMDNVTVQNTGPGAALYMSKDDTEGLDAAIGWGVIDSHFENKARLGILSPDILPDAQHLVYIAHSNPDLDRFTADTQFYNSESTLTSTPGLRHVYTSMGRIMWKSQTFTGGECGVELIDGMNGAWEMDGNDRNVVSGFQSVPSRFDVPSGTYFSYNRTGPSDICSYPYPVPATLAGLQAWFAAHPRTDTDGDGLIDDYESAIGNNPFYPADAANSNVGYFEDLVDVDASKISNFYRFLHSPYLETSGSGGSNRWWDLDEDGLVFYTEYMNGTDPLMPDTDSDGIYDGVDSFPVNASASIDTDNDGQPDSCVGSCTGGLVLDAFPTNASASIDTDNDGQPDSCIGSCTGGLVLDADDDNDTELDVDDNCVLVANTNQLNAEGDALGDACDTDDDNDLVEDSSDADGFTKVLTAAADTYTAISSGDVLSFFTVTGLALNDTITTLDGDDWIDGGTGDDSMSGGQGDDTYVVDAANDTVNEAVSAGTDTVRASVNYIISNINVENLTLTSSSAVTGTGNASANVIDGSGNTAANALAGGAGNDSYIVGTGDTVAETNATTNGVDTVFSSVTYAISDPDVENLTLTGSAVINGGGNASANVIDGSTNAAANVLTGGGGNDTYIVGTDDSVIENNGAGTGTDTVRAVVSGVTLWGNVERLTLLGAVANGTGNGLANILTGNAADNILDGAGAADTMIGGAGNDTYKINVAGETITEIANEGTDTVEASVTGYTLAANVENLTLMSTVAAGTGNGLANILTGNESTNTLSGGAGNDILIGGASADTLTGGTGADQFVLTDSATADATSANDFIKGTDKIVIAMSTIPVGNADNTVDAPTQCAVASGCFSGAADDNELVIFTANTGGTTTTTAAAVIGSATSAMADGTKKIFVVDNGTNSKVYRFISDSSANAAVIATELTLIATLNNVNDSGTGDYLFQP